MKPLYRALEKVRLKYLLIAFSISIIEAHPLIPSEIGMTVNANIGVLEDSTQMLCWYLSTAFHELKSTYTSFGRDGSL